MSYNANAKKTITVTTGSFYTNQMVYRGALIWPKATIFPLASINFYNRIQISGLNLSSNYSLGPLTLSSGIKYFDDSEPWIKLESHNKDFRNQRKPSFDLYGSLYLRFMPGGSLLIKIYKELKEHYGTYGYFTIKLPIFPFVSIGYGIGYGDGQNNQYVFGEGSRAGATHQDYYASLFFPFLPGKGRLSVKYNLSRIYFNENHNGSYIKPTDKPNVISAMVSWSF
jgi:hypothetical protein